ncbi:MAG TPA: DNA polymerase III subunit delta [Ignavibacteriaceae bacterium]|nr:DNA polymerase III subunit delta [Ignavibacteriaceae bacterium]
MAKEKVQIPSVIELKNSLSKNPQLLPVYFLFGEDSFSIDQAINDILDAAKPYLTSEFDKEIYYGEKNSLNEALDAASAFPFGSEKKVIILKDFDKVKDKKPLNGYLKSYPDFTIFIIAFPSKVTSFDTEMYKLLIKNNFIYEAKEIKGRELISKIISAAVSKGRRISSENAQILVEIVGENYSLIDAQLEKIYTFMGDSVEIDENAIKLMSAALKEFTIFELQDALIARNKEQAINIMNNLVDKGKEPLMILGSLIKFFTNVLRTKEIAAQKLNMYDGAKELGVYPFQYTNFDKARVRYSEEDLIRIADALLKADSRLKSDADEKSVLTMMIMEILTKA